MQYNGVNTNLQTKHIIPFRADICA